MRPNPQFPADLVTITEEILNGKLHFLCMVYKSQQRPVSPFTHIYAFGLTPLPCTMRA